MKKVIASLLFIFLFAINSRAQAAHSVTLSWTPSSDATANPTLSYNVYRLNGACPAVAPTSVPGGFTKINAALLTTTGYTDSTVAVGTYCYYATAFLTGTESVPSNDAQGMILPKSPTSLGISIITDMIQVEVPETPKV